MKINTKIKWIGIIVLIIPSILFSINQKDIIKNLAPKYREWLDMVSYIIAPEEKEVFLKLTNDRDRDLFIEAFWKQRDPTPGTPKNEFKEEHIRRFNYANEYLGRGATRPGWMTDMGRIYITLGPPNSIERFEGSSDIYPTQVWYYYGDPKLGLPPYFAIVFYKRGGAGEFKIYNPASDGPASLLIIKEPNIDITNYEYLYNKIKEVAPTLARVAVSLIPGEVPYSYIPSPRNTILLANVMEAPKKLINTSYATHFLNYRGLVSVEYSTNYIDSDYSLSILKDPILNMNFVHFSINPKKISIDYYEPKNQYYFNYKLSVSLKKNNKTIFQYSKDYPFYFDAEEIKRIKSGGISIQDSFPVLEGNYKLTVLLQNSVGKEFCYFEKEISIPEKFILPKILGPILAYDILDDKSLTHMAYKITQKKLLIDSKNNFSLNDKLFLSFIVIPVSKNLWQKGQIVISIKGSKGENINSEIIDLKEYPYKEIIPVFKKISSQLYPDYYQLNVILKNENGEIFDNKKLNFSISSAKAVSHPMIFSKSLPLLNKFLFYYMLASQADKTNNIKMAKYYFSKLFETNPEYKEGILGYCEFLLKNKEFEGVLKFVEKIKNDSKFEFNYFKLKGIALKELNRYSEAIDNLLKANKIYNSDVQVLNSLGFCFYKTENEEEAIKVFNASLKLNSNQKEIKKIIEEIKKSKNLNKNPKN